MNSSHALGFIGLGLVMLLLPVLAPSWVASENIYGPDGRVWWLLGMGGLQTGGGLLVLLREGWRWMLQPGAARTAVERESEPAPAWARATYHPAKRPLRPVGARSAQARA